MSISFINVLAVVGVCLVLDAVIRAQLSGHYRSERTHYFLSLISAVVYIVAWFYGPGTFRTVWLTVMFGLYVYDMAIIIREWHSLKPSYRVFYTAHHLTSFILFGLWGATFNVFTPAMALGAVIWMTSDVWRWADQASRLGGRYTPAWVDRIVFWLERCQRIFAYIAGFIVVGGVPQFREEYIIVVSAFLMDGIDTWFQLRATAARKAAVLFITELCKNTLLFKGLDNAGLDKIGELVTQKSFGAGEIILRQGEEGDTMFVVLEGKATAILEDGTVLEHLSPGDIAGEMSLLSGAQRNANVQAETEVKIGLIKRERFLSLIDQESLLYDAVWRSFAARTLNLYRQAQFASIPLDQAGRLEWIQRGQLISLAADETIKPQDGDVMLVVTGAVEHQNERTKAPALFTSSTGETFQGAASVSVVLLLTGLNS